MRFHFVMGEVGEGWMLDNNADDQDVDGDGSSVGVVIS